MCMCWHWHLVRNHGETGAMPYYLVNRLIVFLLLNVFSNFDWNDLSFKLCCDRLSHSMHYDLEKNPFTLVDFNWILWDQRRKSSFFVGASSGTATQLRIGHNVWQRHTQNSHPHAMHCIQMMIIWLTPKIHSIALDLLTAIRSFVYKHYAINGCVCVARSGAAHNSLARSVYIRCLINSDFS